MLLVLVMAASCAFAQGEETVKCKSGTLVTPIGDLSSCMKRMRTRGLNHTAPPSF